MNSLEQKTFNSCSFNEEMDLKYSLDLTTRAYPEPDESSLNHLMVSSHEHRRIIFICLSFFNADFMLCQTLLYPYKSLHIDSSQRPSFTPI
jgi:hypothetical protein